MTEEFVGLELLIVPDRAAGRLILIPGFLNNELKGEWIVVPSPEKRGRVDHFLPGIRIKKKTKRKIKSALYFVVLSIISSLIQSGTDAIVEVFNGNQKVGDVQRSGDVYHVQIFNLDGTQFYKADSVSKSDIELEMNKCD